MLACIEAGINISGTNAEVAPYQCEFQIGHAKALILVLAVLLF
jgi:glutamine synthetase